MQLYENLLLYQESSSLTAYKSKIYQFGRNFTAKDDPVLHVHVQLSYQLAQLNLGTRQRVLGTQHLVLGT